MTTLGIVNVNSKFHKVERNEAVECKIHGLHTNWRSLKKTKSVKCRYCGSDQQKKNREQNPIKYLLRDAQQHARKTDRDFSICEQDIIDLLEKQNNKCALSGLSFSKYKLSLDRIDSTLGYIKNNIQLVTIDVNKIKTNLDLEYFLNLCKNITEYTNAAKKGI